MSFSSDMKNEIMSQGIKSACCRKALLDGIIASKASCEKDRITLNLENDDFCAFASKLVTEFYGRTPEVSRPPKGGRCRCISFNSKSAAKYIASIEENDSNLFAEKCPGCSASFFKGIFFASGGMSDPAKMYMLEFSPIARRERIAEIFLEIGINLNYTCRRGKPILYVKRSSVIEDFLAYIGMNNATFAVMNAKIEGEIRNNANRVTNCETNNIGKAVTASHRYIEILEELEKHNLLSSLPDELEKTARLRLYRRDLSLAQLAAISIPPISKSGLSHRLNKIMDLAGQLLPSIKDTRRLK